MTLATHEDIVDAEIVCTFEEHVEIVGAHHEAFKFHRDKAAEEAILTGRALIAAKNDLEHGKWIKFMPAVGMSRQYAHRFMQIGENLNVHNCGHLPKAVATLYELSRLAPEDVEHGIESGSITPDMKIKEAKAFARSDWPVVPEPTPEERFQKLEEARAQNIADGISNPPRTREDREADAQEFVQSLIGGTKRQTEPATPEDQFAKALNAVGAAIRVNHGVNEAALNEDGWNVLRALGLR